MSKLSDGQPLTYDYLKGLEEDITRLTQSVNSINQQLRLENANINFSGGKGSGSRGATNVTVHIDRVTITENNSPVVVGNVKFDGVEFSAIPTVVANLLASTDGDNENSPYAVLTIQNITRTGFGYRIQMIRGNTNARDLVVNYIAVGKTSTN
jgi:hypothetical protein